MLKYTLKRLVNAVVVLFIITTATWFLMQLLPGSPIQNAEKLTPEQEAQVEEQYNLDKPLPVQYALYMTGLVRGDLGNSYQYGGRPVNSIILERLPVSVFLGIQAIIVGLVVGLFLGIVSALKQNSIWDSGAAFLAVLGVSVPDFVLAPLAQYWLGLKLGIFPIAFFESWWHSVLPSLVLSTIIAAVIATFTRTEMLEVLGQDYVTLAKAKGLSRLAVVLRHVLRNSMIPLVTIMLPLTAALVTGTPGNRDGLLHTGPRRAVRALDLREGLPDHHGHHHTVLGVFRRFVLLTGHPLRDNRPPHTRGRA